MTQISPDKIPYQFYVIFYRYIQKEFSWTWNFRVNGKRHRYEQIRDIILKAIAIIIVVFALAAVLVNEIFPNLGLATQFESMLTLLVQNWKSVSCGFLLALLILRGLLFLFGAWSKHDKYLRTGLVLHEDDLTATSYEPKGVPSELAVSLSRASNPMCWGYAMRLYCERALCGSPANNKLQFREDELQTFVKKNLIRSWSPLKSKSFISYIPNKQFWNYQELYKDVVPAPPSDPQSVSIRIWNGISSIWSKLRDWCCLDCTHEAEIKRFLKQTAHDFCQQYVQTDSIRSKKQVWAADPKKIQYFRDTWYARINTLSDTDELKTQKKDYMDIVIAEMQDADQNANRHLNERTRQRKNLFRLPILAAMFSVVATMDDFFETEIPIEFFGIPFAGLVEFGCTLASIICATLTAWQAVAQEYGKEAEETWLRQKIYFAKLQNETQKFCDVLKPYNESEVENNIEKYIENIEEVRKMDWKNFFDNMGCQNDVEL